MNRINLTGEFKAEKVRSGKSARGDWELILTSDENGSCAISIFAVNRPSGVAEGGSFRIEKITGVTHGARQDAKGNWHSNVSVNAVVAPAGAVEDEGQLPF